MSTKEKTKTLEEILANEDIDPASDTVFKLILWNDDVNSFNWVIMSLISIIGLSPDKAEKAAWEVHLTGASIIKNGSKDELQPYKVSLEERGLTLTIESD